MALAERSGTAPYDGDYTIFSIVIAFYFFFLYLVCSMCIFDHMYVTCSILYTILI